MGIDYTWPVLIMVEFCEIFPGVGLEQLKALPQFVPVQMIWWQFLTLWLWNAGLSLMSTVQHKWICLPFLLPQSTTTCKHSHLHSLSSCPVWFVREALELQKEVRKQSQMVPISAHLTSPFSRTTKNFKKQTRACNQLNMRESVWKCVVMPCPTNIIKPHPTHQTHQTTNCSAIMMCRL